MTKLKVGIFLGGKSSEKEISLESGRHVYNNLDENKYQKIVLFVDDKNQIWEITEALLWLNTTADIVANLKKEGQRIYFEDLKKTIDFAFVAMHGKFAEDAFPGLFEILNIPNNGAGVLGGALSMDKEKQRLLLQAAGLNVPKYIAISIESVILGRREATTPESNKKRFWTSQNDEEKIKKEIGYPCIVKPSREGSSTALARPKNEEELNVALVEAFQYDNTVLVEEVLMGKEVTTAVIGVDEPYALLPTETPAKGDFLTAQEKFLPGDARMITPPNLPKEVIKLIQDSCIKAYKALSLKIFSRIDGFWTGEKFVILEPNNPPAMTPSTALWQQVAETNMSAKDFLTMIIELAAEAHKNKKGPL
ncbi:hypothetical protein HY030_04050 [Candidatus Gottesmanbacteria bacterium]|nr:hypothetical protein [Candidatus Gottesmanbacteria bacterium]